MEYTPYFTIHPEEFEPFDFDKTPNEFRKPLPNCTKEGIQSAYRFEVECEDETETITKYPEELCKRMVEKFKASKCYQAKSEAERKEIIDYLLHHPEIG